ncbi:MAG: hypothetical protein AB1744_02235 [Candidatus Zixiibacteriota bacterium]
MPHDIINNKFCDRQMGTSAGHVKGTKLDVGTEIDLVVSTTG